MSNRKRICVITAQVEESTQNRFMQGFLKQAYDMNYDVCIFSMFLKYQDSTDREVGDSNIYNLINFNLFDAVVLCQDTIQTPGVVEKLEKRLQSEFANGVVVVVDKENNIFPTVMMDHYTPIVKLVDHLIEVHGHKNIYFLGGLKEHIHSKQRLAGYIDSMKAHNLPVTDDMIYYGTYWYDSGDYMVDELVKDKEHLPDAIVCANDCMAIGVCTAFDRYGIRVPEDIAVVGYDSIEDGRNSPVPITSADIPADDCGHYCMKYIDAKLNGHDVPEFKSNVELYIGGTCGCEGWERETVRIRRDKWETDLSETGFYSCFNNMADDLVAQTSVESFFDTVSEYVYQIRPFESFHLCLNDYWRNPEVMTGDEALRHGYTDHVYRLIKCGPDEKEERHIRYDDVFESAKLLPELYEDRDYPTAFIFTPLFFQDRSFGYAVVNYGAEPRVYEDVYRSWIKTVARDMESFARHQGLNVLLNKLEADQIRDGLTGMYNFRGFIGRANDMIVQAAEEKSEILVLAVDLKNTRQINSNYGRTEGDRVISYVAQSINEILTPYEISMRMGNDEFVIATVAKSGDISRGEYIAEELKKKLEAANSGGKDDYELGIYYGCKKALVKSSAELETLINDTVNQKNRIKEQNNAKGRNKATITNRDLERDEIVAMILDNNMLTYHFQPIVSARDGSIFAYEALMRILVPMRMSPPELLESAERLNRLYDVEKLTLFNVVEIVASNPEMFRGKKVFINSMLGHMLNAQDRNEFISKVKTLQCAGIVIEFTEGAELSDAELNDLKAFLRGNGMEIAIDDYGSGYSNVNNLLRYMPEYVKIDRMLLTGIDADPHRQHFVKDIIEFTSTNDIKALAEGVETTKEMKTVIQLGADLIQGYYTAHPNAEVVQLISPQVVNEIVQYNQQEEVAENSSIFVMEHERSASLLKLTSRGIRKIVVAQRAGGDNNVRIVGAQGFKSDMTLKIKDGFTGTIVLQNVSFSGDRDKPCIDCGENTDLHIMLEGKNFCRNGGIKIPESSRVTFIGDGDIMIRVNGNSYYGIGNDINSKHGVMKFKQEGAINIETNGVNGVAIGAGLGGDIRIEKGRYDLYINGENGVAIGSISTPVNLNLLQADIDITYEAANGVAIGSVSQHADIAIKNTSISLRGSGNRYVAVGTLDGDGCSVDISRAHVDMNLKGNSCIAMGSDHGIADIRMTDANSRLAVQGEACFALGSRDGTGMLSSNNADLNVVVRNSLNIDISAAEQDIRLVNGRYMFVLNNENIERKVVERY